MSALRLAAVFAVAACVALGSAAELEEFNKSFRVEYREKSGEAWKIVNVTGAFRHFHVFYETAMRLQTEGHEHCTFFSAVWAQLDISFYWIIPKLGTKELTPDEQKKFTDLKNSCSDKTPKKQDGEGDKTTADYDNRLPTKRTLVILTLVFGSLACCQLGTVLTILLIACFYRGKGSPKCSEKQQVPAPEPEPRRRHRSRRSRSRSDRTERSNCSGRSDRSEKTSRTSRNQDRSHASTIEGRSGKEGATRR